MVSSADSEADFRKYYLLSRVCAKTYSTSFIPDIRKIFAPEAVSIAVATWDKHLVRCTLVFRAEETVICFRGSVGSPHGPSWRLNYKIKKVALAFGINSRIHSGFNRAAETISKQIIPKFGYRPAINKSNLVITGHSQGSAVALCLAVNLATHKFASNYAVVTFGQPRIGNQGLARSINRNGELGVQRLINRGDPVANTPPAALNYVHCDQPLYLLPRGKYAKHAFFIPASLDPVAPHYMTNYVRRLDMVLKANFD